jgi:hydrogenase maturation factor
MNIVSGVIREIVVEGGMPVARVSVEGALIRVPLVFLKDAAVGDTIVISSGVAISRVDHHQQSEGSSDVSGHTGESPGN